MPAIGVASVALFLLGFVVLGLVACCTSAMGRVQSAAATLSDRAMTDDQKETAAQTAAVALVRDLAAILLRLAGVVGLAALPLAAGHALGLAPASAVVTWLMRLDVVIALTVVILAILAGIWLWRRG